MENITIPLLENDFRKNRDFLRKFSKNGEIEFILDTLADETIIYGEDGLFCKLDTSEFINLIDEDKRVEVLMKMHDNFKKICIYLNYYNSITAWHHFKQFLIDGSLAFEIIYNEKATKIIGFKEIDPISLRPDIIQSLESREKVWCQYEDTPELMRVLSDSQIIYILHGQKFTHRTSYIEGLVRSFNLLRIVENEKIVQNISLGDQDLNHSSDVTYFYDKLKMDSKLPFSRFPDFKGIDDQDIYEIRFAKRIHKFRTIFQEIILKPLWIQFCLDYPDMQYNELIKSSLKLKF